MFVAIEGIDGSGKSTLATLLRNTLDSRGIPSFLTREPTGNFVMDEMLTGKRDPESALKLFFRFTEDRFRHQEELKSHLDANEVVICDRYLMSSLTYQGPLLAPLFNGTRDALDWMLSVSEIIGIRPDVTIYLDIDPHSAMKRLRDRAARTGFEEAEYLTRVRDIYRDLDMDGKVTFDASGAIYTVLKEVIDYLEPKLRK